MGNIHDGIGVDRETSAAGIHCLNLRSWIDMDGRYLDNASISAGTSSFMG
jgi:hypothetical protein